MGRGWVLGALFLIGCGRPSSEVPQRLHDVTPLEPRVDRLVPAPIFRQGDRWVMRRPRSSVVFAEREIDFLAGGAAVPLVMEGARAVSPVGEAMQRARVRRETASGVEESATWARIAWNGAWPGVDVIAEPSQGGLAYRFVLAPGADVAAIALRVPGAVRLTDDARGFDVTVDGGTLSSRGLHAFALQGDRLVELAVRHTLRDQVLGVAVEGWDGRSPLIVDPAIGWSSYFGGSSNETANAVGSDDAGNVYLAGYTDSSDMPKPGAFGASLKGSQDAFVAKVDSAGALVWATYLGGSGNDRALAIAVDPSRNVLVSGYTQSTDFPSSGGAYTTLKGPQDAFLTKISGSGSLVWSTYLGGTDVSPEDRGNGVAVDASGNIVMVGVTVANDFPTTTGLDGTYNGDYDAFVARFTSGGSLVWSTYLGGLLDDVGNAVAMDASGNAWVTGNTVSTGFPLVSALDATLNGTEAFVTRLDPTGKVAFSTFFGGSGADYGTAIAVDGSGNVFVGGNTYSADLPTTGGWDKGLDGTYDGWLARFTSGGTLSWSTYLGGTGNERVQGLCADSGGNVFATGFTTSSNFPSSGGFDTSLGGTQDAFVAQLTGSGGFVFGSYLGGAGSEDGRGIACSGSGNVFLAGLTQSPDFPSSGGFDTTLNGSDAYVVKLAGGKPNGAACGFGYDCLSAFCADGVCCDKACAGTCEACTATRKGTGSDGVCGPIADGGDPDKECAAQSCAAGVVTKAKVCNGAGACRADGTISCGTYACAGNACSTGCTGDAGCMATAHCNGTTCVADLDPGASCTRAAQCKSGFCADGVCCDKACDGACEACTALKKGAGVDGTCGAVAEGTDPKDRCAADPTPLSCAADGMCDGAGSCRVYAKKGTACGATTCTSGAVSGKTCNGAGTCETDTVPCGAFACGTSACKTSCASDVDCAADAFCNKAGICATKQKLGASCGEGRECEKGFCVDGVCCASACTGQCESCGEPGTAGTCVAVTGAPRGARPACAGDPAVCGGACDGTNTFACKLAPATKSCGATCAEGRETPSTCDGFGVCVKGASRTCSPFACEDAERCAIACTDGAGCAAGFRCAKGACVPDLGTCSADGASVIVDGKQTSCSPLRCRGGVCLERCSTSDECADGYVCDPNGARCVPNQASNVGDDGGCSTSGAGRRGSAAWLAFVLGLIGLRVLRRGDADYEAARRATMWNQRVPDRFPEVIVQARDAFDVVAAVRLARREGLRVGVRSGGHSWAGNHVREGGMLLDVSRLDEVTVDARALRATTGPGRAGNELASMLGRHGLFFPTGHCEGVRVGGYLLQGGFGWHGRALGLACENVLALDVVTADGDLVHASLDENADLWWAARGAGPGFFGVVVRFHLRLHPKPRVVGFALQSHPIARLPEVFRWAHRVGPEVPSSVELQLVMSGHAVGTGGPGIEIFAPVFEHDLRSAVRALSFMREVKQSAELSIPFAPANLPMLYRGVMKHYPSGHRWAVDNMWTRASIDALIPGLERIAATMPPPPSHMLWLNWMPPPRTSDMAFSVEDRLYLALYGGFRDARDDARFGGWAEERMREMAPLATGCQLADENLGRRPARFVSDEHLARLDRLRAERDPEGRFHPWMGRP